MTEQRRRKQATRAHMADTGEKYTQARRALAQGAAPPAGGRPPAPPAAGAPGGASMPVHFTDLAHNTILLAQDEARMLGAVAVAPEHLLLAALRTGSLRSLATHGNLRASALFAAILQADGLGAELVRGALPYSSETEEALCAALALAAARGVRGPSVEHLALALAAQARCAALLDQLGMSDLAERIDAAWPRTRAALELQAAPDWRAAMARQPPSPGPVPPLFERYSPEAHAAVDAGVVAAGELESGYVELEHLLIGALQAPAGIAAAVRATWRERFAAATAALREQSAERPARATGIFDAGARALIAEEVPALAARRGEACLSSGHLLLALLDSPADSLHAARAALGDTRALAGELAALLPGAERMSLGG